MQSWSLPLAITFGLVVTALVYLRGWLSLRNAFPNLIAGWRLAAFMSGLFSVWIAVASPLATLDHQSLTIHMMKHLLLMTVAAPLLLAGAPAFPLVCGLPKLFIKSHPPLRQSAGTMARTPSYASGVVLAGGHGRRNRMASSGCVSVGHAFPVGAHLGGCVFSVSWPFVLVAHRAVFAECDKVASVVHGFVPLPCHAAL